MDGYTTEAGITRYGTGTASASCLDGASGRLLAGWSVGWMFLQPASRTGRAVEESAGRQWQGAGTARKQQQVGMARGISNRFVLV